MSHAADWQSGSYADFCLPSWLEAVSLLVANLSQNFWSKLMMLSATSFANCSNTEQVSELAARQWGF